MALRRDDRFSKRCLQLPVRWEPQTILPDGRIPSKTKDGRVQQFCSTHTIRSLGTCEEEFFIALSLLKEKIIRVEKFRILSTCEIYFTTKNKLIMVGSVELIYCGPKL